MPRGRPRKFPSIAELQNMLRERRRHRSEIVQERKKAQARLSEIDRELQMLDGRSGGGGAGGAGGGRGRGRGRGRPRGRPRNESSLTQVMEAVLKKAGKPMRVGEIVEAVQEAGYRSSSANFRGIVNQTLIKDKRFSAASRGHYQLK